MALALLWTPGAMATETQTDTHSDSWVPAAWTTLESGLRVVVDSAPGPALVLVDHPAGASSDADQPDGLAHLVEHLLFAGQLPDDSRSPEDRLFDLGADGQARTRHAGVELATVAPATAVHALLDFETGRLAGPLAGLGEDGHRAELGAVAAERALHAGDPARVDLRVLSRLRWGVTHPESRDLLGEHDVLAGLELDELRVWAATLLAPERATLVLSAPLASDALLALAQAHLGIVAPRGMSPPSLAPPPQPVVGDFVRTAAIGTLSLSFGWPTVPAGHPDEAALDLLAALLADGVSGPLDELTGRRVDAVRVWTDTRAAGGTFMVQVRGRTQSVELLRDRVHRRLRRWRRAGLDQAHLDAVRTVHLAIRSEALERPDTRARAWVACWQRVGRPDCLGEERQAISAVTPARVLEVFDRYLPPERAHRLAVLPHGREDLAAPGSRQVTATAVAAAPRLAEPAPSVDPPTVVAQGGAGKAAPPPMDRAASHLRWTRGTRSHLSLVSPSGSSRAADPDAARLAARLVEGALQRHLSALHPAAGVDLSLSHDALQVDLDLPHEVVSVGLDHALRALCEPDLRGAHALARSWARGLRRDGLRLRAVLQGAQARLLYPADHPYGRVADPRRIRRLRRVDAAAAWAAVGEGGPLELVSVGPHPEELRRPAGCTFGTGAPSMGSPPPSSRDAQRVVVDWPMGDQVQVLMLVPGPAADDPDADALGHLVEALAAGERSRLLSELRHERGWVYTVEGHFQTDPGHGRVRVLTQVGLTHLVATLAVLGEEVVRLAEAPPTGGEHAGLVAAAARHQDVAAATGAGLRASLAHAHATRRQGGPTPVPDATDLGEVAARWLSLEDVRWVLVGDAMAIDLALADAGLAIDLIWSPSAAAAPRGSENGKGSD